ncbi:sulfite exporter TauE/SafE family protein [Parasalinivibrio latis]|uniref:sulfite exporter TauE/SafE family protein n=1 Tax=Parasalinivibrio latis TaxID=2952610 RepID=UPI0030E1B2AE
MTSDFFAAVLVGFLGAGHCISMCGGIAASLCSGVPNSASGTMKWLYLLNYNIGRIFSYCVAGGLVGGVFASAVEITGWQSGLMWLRGMAAIMLILMALYISRIWQGITYIERGGKAIWRYISPLTSRFIPLPNAWSALPFGILWGWLPCGLVYSALSWAAVSGSVTSGIFVMLGFGTGTLPAMLFMAGIGIKAAGFLNSGPFRYTASALLFGYGIYTAYGIFSF